MTTIIETLGWSVETGDNQQCPGVLHLLVRRSDRFGIMAACQDDLQMLGGAVAMEPTGRPTCQACLALEREFA